MWIDTHAHLFDCHDTELRALIDEAKSADVDTIVNTAVSIETAHIVINQCNNHPQNLKAAVGISPFDTIGAPDNWVEKLRELLASSTIIALGEIGLDHTNPRYPSIDIQVPFFKKQLEIAGNANLTAIVHSRGIEKKTTEICRDAGINKAIFHCFTGDRRAMEHIVNCGYYVSVSGIITYKNSHLRDIVRHIPIDKLLIETDAPYLSPVPHRGKPNRPAYLAHTAKEIATLLGIGESELSEILKKNTAAALQRSAFMG